MKGGIGNQMFIYAFAVSLRKSSGKCVLLDSLGALPDYFLIPFSETIRARCGRMIKFLLHFPLFRKYINNLDATDLTKLHTFESLSSITVIDGYFQSSHYFLNPEKIKQDFSFRESTSHNQPCKNSHSGRKIVIHIRGSDYRNFDPLSIGKPYLLPEEYYLKTLSLATNQFPTASIRIISDDHSLATLLSNKIERDCNFEIRPLIQDLREIVDGDCLILSNSSFSWWGAYLNTKKPVVFCAQNFSGRYTDSEYPFGVIESSWIEVEY